MLTDTYCPPDLLRETTEKFTFLEAPDRPEFRHLLQFWSGLRPAGPVYGQSIPAREIAPLLAQIVIWEPVGDWEDARVRLMGSGLEFRFGGNVKGWLMRDLFAKDEIMQHFELLRLAMHAQQPMFLRSHMMSGSVDVMQLDLIVLPIWDTDGIRPLALVCVLRHMP